MYGIHFRKKGKPQGLKVLIGSMDKNSTVCNLSLMAFTRFEFNFTFQIDVPRSEQSLLEIGINRSDRKLQFRMVGNNLIG